MNYLRQKQKNGKLFGIIKIRKRQKQAAWNSNHCLTLFESLVVLDGRPWGSAN